MRWINIVGVTTLSKVQVAGTLSKYWAMSGISTTTRAEGVYMETRPDYWVVRVSLLGAPEGLLERLQKTLSRSKVGQVRDLCKNSMFYATVRSKLKHDAEEKAYVNVAGGRKDSFEVQQAMRELEHAGLGKFARIAMGPLIRATSGTQLTHMPLSPDSTYKVLHKVMDEAYQMANSTKSGPDPELDLMGALAPHWTHHTWRRYADKRARETMEETGATTVDIDLFFGWQEAFYRKQMQIHYAGRRDRVKRSRVTMMV